MNHYDKVTLLLFFMEKGAAFLFFRSKQTIWELLFF